MTQREKLYKHFGALLLEAIVLIVKDEINILRSNAGLSARANTQIMTTLDNKLKTLTKYNWMD